MDWFFPFALMVGLILFFMGLGLPVAFAFFVTNIAGLYLFFGGSVGVDQMISNFSAAVGTYALAPLPLFLIMGSLFFRSGLGDGVMDALDMCIGNLRARLSYVVLAAGAVFSALSGSSLANTGMMGSLMVPEMIKRGYKAKMAYGPVLGAGSLAVVIPPSSLAVLLGSLAHIDVGALLIAGALPGLLLAVMFAALIFVQTLLDPEAAPQYPVERVPMGRKIKAIAVNIVPMGVIVFLVVGTIILGIATPTESSALGCAGVLGLLIAYRCFTWKALWTSLDDAMRVTGMTFLIISASTTFSQVFAFSGASNGFIGFVTGFDPGPYLFLFLMVCVILILGMFMDQVSMMLITLPIFLPIAAHFQFDLVWFGLILLLAFEVGFTTPPFGLLLFVMVGVAPPGTSLKTVALSAAPFIACTLLLIVLIVIFPQIALFLPNLF
ncbi:TRAP transporter large permease [Pararhizobium mangrovi]|uniref:TRAP transporter large permease protein n=1 Tax=Pararhizobium mangrovi TaxID=2590452 RepID=A0A506U746_9HYPH|nr:TRAP transporter large permease subunit [Pararhizobium mangrovi]TPW30193.1 TRAP transporter large permease subunit [Pararhizobium mangrovi]